MPTKLPSCLLASFASRPTSPFASGKWKWYRLWEGESKTGRGEQRHIKCVVSPSTQWSYHNGNKKSHPWNGFSDREDKNQICELETLFKAVAEAVRTEIECRHDMYIVQESIRVWNEQKSPSWAESPGQPKKCNWYCFWKRCRNPQSRKL